jgi:hypothetical protein
VQIDKTEMPGLAPGIFISAALPREEAQRMQRVELR